MLKEKSFYKENLPVNVVTANISEYPIHFHEDIEVVYVLKGPIKLKNGYYTYTLNKGDIFILNDKEMHSFYTTGEENMVMMLQLNYAYFSKYYDNLRNSFFVTDMKDGDDEVLEALRGILARIMLDTLEKGYGYEHKIIESAHNLLSSLLANFQYFAMEDGKFVNEMKNKGNKILAGRLNRITNYMYENYTRRLTLNEIAEMEHLSIYYLSHVIKEATGLSFQELLSFIRVEESEKLLLGTDKKIGVISEESGFSAVRYYIKYFQTWFGMHPSEYRERYTGKVKSRESSAQYTLCTPESIVKAIKHLANDVYLEYANEKGPDLTIVDLDLDDPTKTPSKTVCGLAALLESEAMEAASYPYRVFKSLDEKVIAAGDNYAISRIHKNTDKEGYSIILYNNNDKVKELAKNQGSLDKVIQTIAEYEDKGEILIRISGINGEYKISRYRFSKDYFLMNYEGKWEPSKHVSKRERIINRWATTPIADFSQITAMETLSIQSILQGFSAELILIDKVTN